MFIFKPREMNSVNLLWKLTCILNNKDWIDKKLLLRLIFRNSWMNNRTDKYEHSMRIYLEMKEYLIDEDYILTWWLFHEVLPAIWYNINNLRLVLDKKILYMINWLYFDIENMSIKDYLNRLLLYSLKDSNILLVKLFDIVDEYNWEIDTKKILENRIMIKYYLLPFIQNNENIINTRYQKIFKEKLNILFDLI